jgi:hypothetical protein
MKKLSFILFFLFPGLLVFSQPDLQLDSSIVVKVAGNNLKFPWAGGLNFTNWGLLDLDNDGFKDLVVFDKSGSKIRTFINDKVSGQANYTHNSIYENKFPFVNSWFATYDYNCDGLEDVFTYDYPGPGGGIRVFRNAGNMQFAQMGDYLKSDYGTSGIFNVPDNGIGIPGLVDIDGDGDMDIIVFDVMAYNIEYHQNQSKQLYGNCDSLAFTMVDKCWGKFNEGLCQVQLDVCPYPKITPTDSVMQTMHAGSGLMCFDADGDGLIDLLEGDLSCDSVFFLSNKGIVSDAHMTSYTTLYPPSHPIAMSIFPSTYFLDVNNDNKRDLIAAPNWQGSENFNNQWLYLNGGADNSPNFNYVKDNFLQEDMIDIGEGAYPTLFDYEGDGDLDLLVGNFGYYSYASSGDTSAISFYKNIGSATTPTFSLMTTNFANLSSLSVQNMVPTTGDLDGDGDADLLIGVNNGEFYYFTNTAAVGNPAIFSSTPTASYGVGFLTGIRVGTNKAFPQLIDLDKDGKLDLISGTGSGKIYYFHNVGTTTTPSFTLVTNLLGGINVSSSSCGTSGYSTPFVFSYGGGYKMSVGSGCGNIFLYDVPAPANLSNAFTLISENAYGIYAGQQTAPVFFDLNGDTYLDMMIGNYSGGLNFYHGLSTTYVGIEENKIYSDILVFPNPASDVVKIKFNAMNVSSKKIQLMDLSGRVVKEVSCRENQSEISIFEFSNGIYFLNVQVLGSNNNLQNAFTQKIIISHE